MSKIEKVETDEAFVADRPYSQAVIAGNFIFCSGQIAPEGGLEYQTKMVINNLKSVLIAAGSDLDQVVKTEVYLKNMDDFEKMNKVYSECFNFETKPARVTVEVSKLPKNALIEISCVACKK